jgi:uncharacterized protein (DUF2062 family)
MEHNVFQRIVIDPIVKLLRQGISPEKIALAVAIGVVIGITTLLSALAAIVFRLNLPAMQILNYLVYPLQIALLIPFFQLGALLFGAEPLPLSASQLILMFKTDFWHTIDQLWSTTLRAIMAWSLIYLPTVGGLYFLMIPLLRRFR